MPRPAGTYVPMVIFMHRFNYKLGIHMCTIPRPIAFLSIFGNIKTTDTSASAHVTGSLHSQVCKLKSTHMKQGCQDGGLALFLFFYFRVDIHRLHLALDTFTPGAPIFKSFKLEFGLMHNSMLQMYFHAQSALLDSGN